MKIKISHVLTSVVMLGTVLSVSSCKKEEIHKFTEEELLDLSKRDYVSKNGMVAAANPYAANIGLEILEAGGNAFDAAAGVSFALGLVEPYASGIGGGGILVGYNSSTGEKVSYNFREFAPGLCCGTSKKGTPVYNTTKINDVSEWGDYERAAGVPTIVKSLLGIIESQGSGAFGDEKSTREAIIGPTVKLAKEGFTVTPSLATAIQTLSSWTYPDGNEAFVENEEIGAIYGDDELQTFPKGTGDKIVNQNLANVYQEIIDKGSDGFYKGWVADAILDAIGTDSEKNEWGNKGLVTQEDLDYANNDKNYPKECTPVNGDYNGYKIISSTTPSSGGIILLESLNMLEHYINTYSDAGTRNALTKLGRNSAEYINLMLTITQLAYGDKQKYIGDTSISPITNQPYITVPIKGLTSKAYAAVRLGENYTVGQQYNGKYTTESKSTSPYGGVVNSQNYGDPSKYNGVVANTNNPGCYDESEDEHYSTTSFSIADKDGNIVSVTQTINHFWGNHIMPEGCGFFLNNNLSSFSTSSTSASYFRPYKHPTSHIMPTIVLDKDDNPICTIGSPGSMRIPTAVFETLVNMFEWNEDIQTAIDAPRVYNYCISTGLNSDQGSFDPEHKACFIEQTGSITAETVQQVKDMGYEVFSYNKIDKFFGGVHAITFEKGNLHGGADSRRDGKALGY